MKHLITEELLAKIEAIAVTETKKYMKENDVNSSSKDEIHDCVVKNLLNSIKEKLVRVKY